MTDHTNRKSKAAEFTYKNTSPIYIATEDIYEEDEEKEINSKKEISREETSSIEYLQESTEESFGNEFSSFTDIGTKDLKELSGSEEIMVKETIEEEEINTEDSRTEQDSSTDLAVTEYSNKISKTVDYTTENISPLYLATEDSYEIVEGKEAMVKKEESNSEENAGTKVSSFTDYSTELNDFMDEYKLTPTKTIQNEDLQETNSQKKEILIEESSDGKFLRVAGGNIYEEDKKVKDSDYLDSTEQARKTTTESIYRDDEETSHKNKAGDYHLEPSKRDEKTEESTMKTSKDYEQELKSDKEIEANGIEDITENLSSSSDYLYSAEKAKETTTESIYKDDEENSHENIGGDYHLEPIKREEKNEESTIKTSKDYDQELKSDKEIEANGIEDITENLSSSSDYLYSAEKAKETTTESIYKDDEENSHENIGGDYHLEPIKREEKNEESTIKTSKDYEQELKSDKEKEANEIEDITENYRSTIKSINDGEERFEEVVSNIIGGDYNLELTKREEKTEESTMTTSVDYHKSFIKGGYKSVNDDEEHSNHQHEEIENVTKGSSKKVNFGEDKNNAIKDGGYQSITQDASKTENEDYDYALETLTDSKLWDKFLNAMVTENSCQFKETQKVPEEVN